VPEAEVRVDPADLIDNHEVAEIIGISSSKGVSVYRRRYSDFPEPLVQKRQTVLWLREEIEAWARRHGRQ
jgi:predicted DNA-binding transcriptional regulator AlpA